MKTVTTHQAKTHLSRLLKEVQTGETIVILNGKVPVAKLIRADKSNTERPRAGTPTSEPITYADDAFQPLTDAELKEWEL